GSASEVRARKEHRVATRLDTIESDVRARAVEQVRDARAMREIAERRRREAFSMWPIAASPRRPKRDLPTPGRDLPAGEPDDAIGVLIAKSFRNVSARASSTKRPKLRSLPR